MDALREGIGLQGYGQKDPKKEYKRIGFDMFSEMMGRIQTNTVSKLFRVRIERHEESVPAIREELREMTERGVDNKSEDAEQGEPAAGRRRDARGRSVDPVRRERPKVGRNDPCPCGSRKKYKKCHGKEDEPDVRE